MYVTIFNTLVCFLLVLLFCVIATLFKQDYSFVINKFLRSDIMNDKNFKKSKMNVQKNTFLCLIMLNVCIYITNKPIRISTQVIFHVPIPSVFCVSRFSMQLKSRVLDRHV